ncbi:MAG: hypothetical protein EB084_25525, partial [Proteobacteria bacterium]|nr:hypothetical protein [Pseudomonadota bacterium]
MSTVNAPKSFTVTTPKGEPLAVAPKRAAEAAKIDVNGDGVCSDAEIVDYMQATDVLHAGPAQGNIPRITEEFKAHLTGQRVATANFNGEDYRSLAQLEARMHELAADHPDRCQLVSLGQTHEGRDIWALKVSSDAQGDTSNKPGVVFTGAHHAREWMTPEVTLGLAEDMIENYGDNPDMKRRVDGAETWFIPVVNPDGFAYTQTDDNMWRKNRMPIHDPKNPNGNPIGYGVDLNRNYWDGKPEHLSMYRHDGDSPKRTWDDFGASDSVGSDAYRGQGPATEKEVQALIAFENSRPNLHGVIDHHSYGNLLMRPWDDKADDPENVADYDEVAQRMLTAQGKDPYQYIQTYDLYPTTGASVSFHHVSGRFGFGVEMGDSFQPPFSEFPALYKTMSGADFAF